MAASSSRRSTGSSATSCACSTTRRPSRWRSATRAQDVPATSWPLAEAFRDGTSHPVVFLHGLCENDESWTNGAKVHGTTYAERILAETDGTPVMIRYNTGLHISENGKHLDALLQHLVESWPVPVTRITLIGHSMGGLVARAATNHATASGQTWQHLVRDVVCLGTPHAGANLEKVAHLGSRLLRFWPGVGAVQLDPREPFGRHRRPAPRLHHQGRVGGSGPHGSVGPRPHRRCAAAARRVPLRRRHARRVSAPSAERRPR